jgi:putative sigma-54 modulation protein
VTLRARDASPDIVRSINLCADELHVQVKRHRDKRRRRREQRAAAAAGTVASAGAATDGEAVLAEGAPASDSGGPAGVSSAL